MTSTTRSAGPRTPRSWLLPVLAAVSLAGYVALGRLPGAGGAVDVTRFLALMAGLFVLYGAALWTLRAAGWGGRREAWLVLLGALVFRLALVPAGLDRDRAGGRAPGEPAYTSFLLYDNDVWRYLWDGHVLLAGVDTYRFSPAEIEERSDEPPFDALLADEGWQEVHARVGYPEYRTVYPPLAQAAFVVSTALAPASVAAWKALVIAVDLGTCLLLVDLLRRRGRGPGLAAVYAWNPLAVEELAGSGHVDGLLVACLVLALWLLERGRPTLALAAFGGAVLVKLTPLLVLPLWLRRVPRRGWWVMPVLALAAYAPFLASLPVMADSLAAFARGWTFNPGPWLLVFETGRALGIDGRWAADLVSAGLTLGVLAAVLATAGRRERADGGLEALISGCRWVLGAYLLLSPTVMPWYLLWVLPLWALRPGVGWPLVTAASLLSYLVYVDGVEHTAVLAAEYAVVALALAWEAWRRKLRTSSSAP